MTCECMSRYDIEKYINDQIERNRLKLALDEINLILSKTKDSIYIERTEMIMDSLSSRLIRK